MHRSQSKQVAEPSVKPEEGVCDALRESQTHESSDKRDRLLLVRAVVLNSGFKVESPGKFELVPRAAQVRSRSEAEAGVLLQ